VGVFHIKLKFGHSLRNSGQTIQQFIPLKGLPKRGGVFLMAFQGLCIAPNNTDLTGDITAASITTADFAQPKPAT